MSGKGGEDQVSTSQCLRPAQAAALPAGLQDPVDPVSGMADRAGPFSGWQALQVNHSTGPHPQKMSGARQGPVTGA